MLEITIKKSFLKQILETIKQQKYILTSGLTEDAIADEQKDIDRIYNEGMDLVNTFQEAVNQLSAEKSDIDPVKTGLNDIDTETKIPNLDVDGKLPPEGTGSEPVLEKDNAPVDPANVSVETTGSVETKADTVENGEGQDAYAIGAKVCVEVDGVVTAGTITQIDQDIYFVSTNDVDSHPYSKAEILVPADEATKEALNSTDEDEAQHQQNLADEAAANQANQVIQ